MAKNIDWKNLGFKYFQTEYYLKCEYKNGKWGEIKICSDPYLNIHIAATCLHYGQACFEGLKAFGRKDGSIAIFRPQENAKRLISSAKRLVMEPPSEELFLKMAHKLVLLNKTYVPPYGTDASLYIRPVLIGTSPHIGLHPSEDYLFFMIATPMGPYYKNGFFPVKAYVQENYDRAAPKGVGNIKAAGNYAAGLKGDLEGKEKGYTICLYLDSAQHRYIDEFGTSNFFAITKEGAYVTPDSTSILPSVTNMSLQTIAEDMGLRVERRKIQIEEVEYFKEVGACGTAVVITPIYSIQYRDKLYTFGKENEAGPTLTKLYKEIKGIQYGDIEDRHNWMYKVNLE
jgi:branched-chain amino acid aminotransferase